jgi:enoyl-CoA hydratase/carnithine racemase
MAEEVLTERRDNVLVVTINRPDAKNAVNEASRTPWTSSTATTTSGWE